MEVTPRAGVWIEILYNTDGYKLLTVTPRAGVWIEISRASKLVNANSSLPVRECGLK